MKIINETLIFPCLLEKLFQEDYAAKNKSSYLRIISPLKGFVLFYPFPIHFVSVRYPFAIPSICYPFAIRSEFSPQV